MCVTADPSNKVGRSQLDTRGRLCTFMAYSTQHAGDVYRFLPMKTNHIIYSWDVQWLGKLWHEFYHVPNMHSADKYIDPFDDCIEETGNKQKVEHGIQEPEPETEQTPMVTVDTNVEEDELIATRT